MQNRVTDITMDKSNKKYLSYFLETVTWGGLRLIKTHVVDPQNEFTAARAPTFPENSEVQVTVEHDFSDTFERE